MKKISFENYKIKTSDSKLKEFQDYALKIIKEFGIIKPYDKIIFKHASKSKAYLEGKVAICYERFGKDNLEDKGPYLISLFRKTKPWENENKKIQK